jgi:hypothetical protein
MPDSIPSMFRNLAHYHHEHEKHYSEAPLRDALTLQGFSRSLKALAERWSLAKPSDPGATSPFAGASDLNDERAIEASGVLFMEGGEPPAEIVQIRRELESTAAAAEETSAWLGSAMDSAWTVAEGLLDFPALADLLGERHSIIAHDMQNAALLRIVGRQLRRANAILERVDFSAAGIRADLAGPRHFPAYLFSASELIDQAADLAAESAMLVHQNERKWRVFIARLDEVANGSGRGA